MQTNQDSTGFTLVEVLIIAPIVILFIGAFIGLAVTLTSDSLRLRERNEAAYNVQDALNEIESEASLATSFNTTTGTLTSPQGKDNATAAFTNTASSQPDTLILKSAATTKSLYDPTRELVYTGSGACDARNPIYQIWTVFFVSNGSLYKRTILPSEATCAAPWQRNTCAETHVAANPGICQTEDSKLLDSVSTFDVSYFVSSTDTTAITDSEAADANSVSINTTVSKQVAGDSFTYSGRIRITSLNSHATD